ACSGAGFVGGAGSSTADERMRQLILENQALREAFSDTQKRLMRLEDEKREFQDEGIYDVVNSICGKTSGTGRQPTVNDLNQVNDLSELSSNGAAAKGDTGAITYMMSGSNDLAACEPCPRESCTPPGSCALSPESAAIAHSRRQEEERRSDQLNLENEELRRELARASEVGEALEQQRQSAEDRMHALLQEHDQLVERLQLTRSQAGQWAEMADGPEELGSGEVDAPPAAAKQEQAPSIPAAGVPLPGGFEVHNGFDMAPAPALEPIQLEEAW
ncbi:unnamed protein product, partial [Polarella glacialis]